MSPTDTRFALPRTALLAFFGLLGLVFTLLISVSADATTPPKRELPDYDGRGGGGQPTTPGDVLLWVPRVVLFPPYLVSEYLVRRPLGWLITSAERAQVPAALYDFFAFGPDHKAGFVPTAFVDLGFRPSIGVYAFWDDAGFEGHELRAHASTGGKAWWFGRLTERFPLGGDAKLTLTGGASRRPDYAYYGPGPSSQKDAIARYGSDKVDARTEFHLPLFGSSSLDTLAGYSSSSFYDGHFAGNPSVQAQVAAGAFPQPDGYAEGYSAIVDGVRLVLDSRRSESPRGSGGRLFLHADHGTDVRSADLGGWIRYGGYVGGILDIADSDRAVGLFAAARFAEPLGPRPVPFTELVTLGGAEAMPGFRDDRLRDRSAVVGALRYSWPIWVWLNGSLQGSVGNVFGPELEGFDFALMRLSAALGIESHGSSDSVFQFVVGFGTETFQEGTHIESIRLTIGARNGF